MKPAPIPYHRTVTLQAEAAVAKRFAVVLARVGARAASTVRAEKMAKAEGDDVDRILGGIDLSDLEGQGAGLGADIVPVVEDSVAAALVQIGPDDADGLTDVVNGRAVAAAKAGAAEKVAGITDATREMLRQTIEDGLANNLGMPALANEIEKSYAFSPERAELIAATEVSRANSEASLASYQAVAASGVPVRKVWLAEPGCCPVCEANQAAGAIALDDAFPGGGACPPQHPRCRCAISPVVGEAGDDAQDQDGDSDVDQDDDEMAAAARAIDLNKSVSSDDLLAPYRAQASRYVALRKVLIKFGAAIDAADALAKTDGSVGMMKVQIETARAIKRIDDYLAQPLPMPAEILLGLVAVQGNA